MPRYKPPRPDFNNTSTQEYIKIFLSKARTPDASKARSVTRPNSPLDLAIQAFKAHTPIPLMLPVMGFMHLVAAWLMKQGAHMSVKGAEIHPDIWTIALSDSGAGKTYAFNMLQKASEKMLGVKADFEAVASAAAYVDELNAKNRGLWFYDEFAQFLVQVENITSNLGQCKEYLLKTYDGNLIQRKTKLRTVSIEKPMLSIFGLNTPESFLNHISEESFTDGFSQRFSYVIAKACPDRKMGDFPWFDNGLITTALDDAFSALSKVKIHPCYSVPQETFIAYEAGFRDLLSHDVSESFYRRLMFRSFKYAMIFHVIHGDPSADLTVEDMGYALRMVEMHIDDLKELLTRYNYGALEKMVQRVQTVQKQFEAKKKTFGVREVIQYERKLRSVGEARELLRLVNELNLTPSNTPRASNESSLLKAA